MDGLSQLARVVIQKSHGLEVEPRIVPDLPQDLLPRVPSPDDQELLSLRPFLSDGWESLNSRAAGKIEADCHTHSPYGQKSQEPVHNEDGPGIPFEVVDHEHDEDYEKGACEDRLEHVHQIHQACVSPHPAIQVEKRKKADLNQNDKMPALLEGRQVLLRNVKFEAKEIR